MVLLTFSLYAKYFFYDSVRHNSNLSQLITEIIIFLLYFVLVNTHILLIFLSSFSPYPFLIIPLNFPVAYVFLQFHINPP